MDFLGQISAAVLIVVVSTLITTRIALHKYRTEKWWDAKIHAYVEIIDAIYGQAELSLDAITEIQVNNLSINELVNYVKDKHMDIMKQIMRSRNTKAIYFSQDSINILDAFFSNIGITMKNFIEKPENSEKMFKELNGMSHQCIISLSKEARRDLNVEIKPFPKSISDIKNLLGSNTP